jgi:serine/threonine protein kinase
VRLSGSPQPDLTASERVEIEREAERFARELREGNHQEIDVYLCRVAPSLRERLREELVGEEFSYRYGDATKDGKLRYWPVSQLGKGGFARVYAALDAELGRFVAIKVLASTERIAKLRFLDEARRQAGLKHPNLVQIHETGELPKGHPYVVMDYIAGGTLREKLESEGTFDPRRAARILGQVAFGVAAAHERTDGSRPLSPLVHQDLKPENILLDHQNQAYVADFGLAAAVTDLQDGLAGIGGTMRYMSPEQLNAFSSETEPPVIDTQSDVWALGIMCFELMTGKHPFVDSKHPDMETAESILSAIKRTDVRGQLAQYQPARIPTDLAHLIADCLELSTERRLVSAKDVAVRLEEWLNAADNVVQLQLPISFAALSNVYCGAPAEKHQPPMEAELGHVLGKRLSRFVWVPPGNGFSRNLTSFYKVPEGFWIGATPVTNAEYEAFLAKTGYRGQSEANNHYRSFSGKFSLPTHPAVGVSWINAMRFCH